MFNKSHIKPGMLVELLDFDECGLYYVTLCEKGMILINNNGYYAYLKDFNDDLATGDGCITDVTGCGWTKC